MKFIRQWAMASGQPAADMFHAMAVPSSKLSDRLRAVRELMKGFLTEGRACLAKRAKITGHRLNRGMPTR